MSKNQQINIIASIGEDLIEGIRDFTNILEGMKEEINELKEWKEQVNIK